MVDKARRPYLDLDNTETLKPGTPQRPLETSLVRTPSRYLSTSLDRESEFEKPYLGTSPRKQHLDPPGPDWPDIPGFPPGTIPPIIGDPVGPGCPACALAFDAIYDCDEDWGEAHAMIYCSMQPGTDCPDCTMQITAIVGAIVDIQPGTWSRRLDPLVWNSPFGWRADLPQNQGRQSLPPTTGTMSLKVKVASNIATHVLRAEMIDGAGNYCETYLEVSCACECPPKIPFTIDAANTDTVSSGKTAQVTVLGGCKPYVWAVSGAGWSIAPSGSSDLMAAIITVNTSTCNKTTSVPVATVTATDFCGTTLTQKIKHEGGGWEGIAGWARTASCDQAAQCGSDGLSCAGNGVNVTVYGVGGTGNAYDARWDARWIPGGCHAGSSDYPHSTGGGSTCGGGTLTASAAGFPGAPGACDCSGYLYYWTCGADCD